MTLSLSLFLAVAFTEEEKVQMRKFTNRSYLLDKKARFHVWLSLVDIILAYVYDVRTTEGEHNVSGLLGRRCLLAVNHEVPVTFSRPSFWKATAHASSCNMSVKK